MLFESPHPAYMESQIASVEEVHDEVELLAILEC
jgi:hypothetical protein